MNMDYVCSNCGHICGKDTRMNVEYYLICSCTTNSVWIDDGRGGYYSYLNGAHPIPADQFKGRG
jgi:hypothetical protein